MSWLSGILGFFQTIGSLLKLYNGLVAVLGEREAKSLISDGAECTRQLVEIKNANLPFVEKVKRRYEILDRYSDFWGRAVK